MAVTAPFEMKRDDENFMLHYNVCKDLADCLMAVGRVEEARKEYEQAGFLIPQKAEIDVALGTIESQSGNIDQARKYFMRALRKNPACSEAYSGLAMIHQQEEELPKAFDMYLKSLEIDGENLVALLGLFQVSCKMGTFAKVTRFLEVYLEKHPGDTSVLFCLATLYARDGKLDQARETLDKVLVLNPDQDEATDLLQQIERNMQKTRQESITT